MEQKFYICHHCGTIVAVIDSNGGERCCCGESMTQLIPNTCGEPDVHIPICRVRGNTVSVTVGAIPHPMTQQHHIGWIFLRTHKGSQFRRLHPGQVARACFVLCPGDRVEEVYAHCNIHGLWNG